MISQQIYLCVINGYAIQVYPLPPSSNIGCIVDFPENLFLSPIIPAERRNYVYKDGKLNVYMEIFMNNKVKYKDKSVEVSNYAFRPLIMSDIVKKMQQLQVSQELICVKIDDSLYEANTLLKMMFIELSKEEEKKEKQLISALSKSDKSLCSDDIVQDFSIITSYLEGDCP